MAAQRLQVGVVAQPFLVSVSELNGSLDEVQSLLHASRRGVDPGKIVKKQRVVGVHPEGSLRPDEPLLRVIEGNQRSRTEVQRPGIIRMQTEMLLGDG